MQNIATKDFRSGMTTLDSRMINKSGILMGGSPEYFDKCPLKETFADGCYIRELAMPKGMIFSTKIHKFTHPYFLLKGDCSVLTEDGIVRLKAPFSGITKAGTKRLIYTHEDTIWITVHVTDETDTKKIEDDITTTTFDKLDNIIDAEFEIENFVKEITKGECV